MTCPEGQARYQATANLTVDNKLQEVWTARCHPLTHEVATLVLAALLVQEAPDGSFPVPEVIAVRCCGG